MSALFAAAERVADAILYEGYVLYPYRASAAKNQLRWQFGVVAPRPPQEEDGEPWYSQTECLIALPPPSVPGAFEQARRLARVFVRLRFLRPRSATTPAAGEAPPGADRWLEGVPHVLDLEPLQFDVVPAMRAVALDAGGVTICVLLEARFVDGLIKLRVRVENKEPWLPAFAGDRDEMLRHSLVSAHLLLAIEGGEFVSLLEPPPPLASTAGTCANRHVWPVLVGDRGRRALMLSSPIVLYDYPAVAKESPGDLCDAAEIDEILSLRILTLTDDEKREARATDPRSRAIVDRVESLSPEAMASLHGTMRGADFFNPPATAPPDEAFVLIDGARVGKGARVWLRPKRRADTMDIFLRDQAATVAGVYRDVDDRVYLAVTVDADPAAALHESFGRFFYFDPAEIEIRREK
jgi:hypothetical protein